MKREIGVTLNRDVVEDIKEARRLRTTATKINTERVRHGGHSRRESDR